VTDDEPFDSFLWLLGKLLSRVPLAYKGDLAFARGLNAALLFWYKGLFESSTSSPLLLLLPLPEALDSVLVVLLDARQRDKIVLVAALDETTAMLILP
jgi:hypothetical protein